MIRRVAVIVPAADEEQRIGGTVLPGPALGPGAGADWVSRHHLREGHPHVHGANLGIRGDAYLALGGWPPMVTGEDVELAGRAARTGYLRVTRTAAIPVVTSIRQYGRAPHVSPVAV